MECVWSILGYQTYPSPSPAVIEVKVHTERRRGDITYVGVNGDEERDGGMSQLQKYFARPASLEHLKCLDLFEQYTIRTSAPRGLAAVFERIEVAAGNNERNSNRRTVLYFCRRNECVYAR